MLNRKVNKYLQNINYLFIFILIVCFEGKESLCTITLSDILAVERLQQESFNKNNMFQIIQPERILYIQANNCVEEKEWVDLLTKMCFSNSKRLTLYHPAAFINGTWLW